MLTLLSKTQLKPFIEKITKGEEYQSSDIKTGLLNQNVKIRSKKGNYLLKVYRAEMNHDRIDIMHKVMQKAKEYDIPTPLPIHTEKKEGYLVSIYPFIEGKHPKRYQNSTISLFEMGKMLGRIHRALDEFDSRIEKPTVAEFCKKWDKHKTLNEIDSLESLIENVRNSSKNELHEMLSTSKKLILSRDWSTKGFEKLEMAYCHGDYHTRNIIVEDKHISAVLDWEKAEYQFRNLEIMRALMFTCRKNMSEFSWSGVKAFLNGYKTEHVLREYDARYMVNVGTQNLLFSFWAIRKYIEGRKELKRNMLSRFKLGEYLVKEQDQISDRVYKICVT